MGINFPSILKTFVMDFRDNGFSIDGKSILIDGNPWGLNPGPEVGKKASVNQKTKLRRGKSLSFVTEHSDSKKN